MAYLLVADACERRLRSTTSRTCVVTQTVLSFSSTKDWGSQQIGRKGWRTK